MRAWVRPGLVSVIRNRPEETVLSGCKAVYSGSGSGVLDNGCLYFTTYCKLCSGYVIS